MKIKLALIALVTVLFVSCNSTKTAVEGIEGRTWKLKTLEGQDMSTLKLDKEVSFYFEQRRQARFWFFRM